MWNAKEQHLVEDDSRVSRQTRGRSPNARRGPARFREFTGPILPIGQDPPDRPAGEMHSPRAIGSFHDVSERTRRRLLHC